MVEVFILLQSPEVILMLQSGDTVPNFSQQSSQGKIDFYDWAEDSWIVN